MRVVVTGGADDVAAEAVARLKSAHPGAIAAMREIAGAEDIALTVSSAGKAFAVTGWKVGRNCAASSSGP